MFKTYKVLLAPDDNTGGGDSSTPADATKTTTSQSDSQSETTEQSDNAEVVGEAKTPLDKMSKIAHAILEKSESQTDTAEEKEGVVPDKDNTEEQKPDAEEETEPASTVEKEGPVPYKRFKEVNTAKAELETKVKEWEPLVQAQVKVNETLQAAGVTVEEYQDAVEFLTLVRTNPRAAIAKIKPLYNALQQFDEGVLPKQFQDKIDRLDARVKEGEMSEEAAKELRELYMAQGKLEVGSKANSITTEAQQKAYEKQVVQSYVNAASAWGKAKSVSDTDYKPKAKADDADGVFEITEAKFTQLISTQPIKSPQDVTKYLEQAYESAKKIFVSRKPATKKVPSSSTTVSQQLKKPKSYQEVAARVAAKHGVSYSPR